MQRAPRDDGLPRLPSPPLTRSAGGRAAAEPPDPDRCPTCSTLGPRSSSTSRPRTRTCCWPTASTPRWPASICCPTASTGSRTGGQTRVLQLFTGRGPSRCVEQTASCSTVATRRRSRRGVLGSALSSTWTCSWHRQTPARQWSHIIACGAATLLMSMLLPPVGSSARTSRSVACLLAPRQADSRRACQPDRRRLAEF